MLNFKKNCPAWVKLNSLTSLTPLQGVLKLVLSRGDLGFGARVDSLLGGVKHLRKDPLQLLAVLAWRLINMALICTKTQYHMSCGRGVEYLGK